MIEEALEKMIVMALEKEEKQHAKQVKTPEETKQERQVLLETILYHKEKE